MNGSQWLAAQKQDIVMSFLSVVILLYLIYQGSFLWFLAQQSTGFEASVKLWCLNVGRLAFFSLCFLLSKVLKKAFSTFFLSI